MKEIVVISGKGGTGKTIITASLASLAQNKVMADCDVDAADLHLILNPSSQQQSEFVAGQNAEIDQETCSRCGLCREVCRFDAVTEDYRVNPLACEGCCFCYNICPNQAITMHDNMAGHWYLSQTRYGPLVHAKLGVAQENSGKLVALVKQKARQVAEEKGLQYLIADGPPGIGCPVISSLSGAHLAVIVTEPTLSGIHDLERVAQVCHHFKVPMMVCINKCDLNHENSAALKEYCRKNGIEVAAEIPFDTVVTEALVKRQPVVEYSRNGIGGLISNLWQNIEAAV